MTRNKDPAFAIAIDLPPVHGGQRTAALHRQLREAIIGGRIATGEVLPSSRRAAEALGVSRKTVISAYDLLIAEGYVLPRPGGRTAVGDGTARQVPRLSSTEARSRVALIAPAWRDLLQLKEQFSETPERNFQVGIPEHRYFPYDDWRRLSAQAWRKRSQQPFFHPPVEGMKALREAIAQHIAFSRGVACSGDDVVVTSGAQHAFDLLARLLIEPGRTKVAIESPGYPPLRDAFAAAGAEILPVPVDDEGLRVDLLSAEARVVCVTPSHQSPTGAALSMARRTALLAHVQSHDAVVVEDDYDGEFRYGQRPLDALQTLDCDGRVFYVGTFSKSLFPAIKTGFIVVPVWARAQLLGLKRIGDSQPPGPLQETLAAFVRHGHLARHVRRMTTIYAERRAALLDGLCGLRRWLVPIPSQAGLHLATRVVPGTDLRSLESAIRKYAPGARTTAEFSFQAEAEPAVVFGYSVIDRREIEMALSRLERALLRAT